MTLRIVIVIAAKLTTLQSFATLLADLFSL